MVMKTRISTIFIWFYRAAEIVFSSEYLFHFGEEQCHSGITWPRALNLYSEIVMVENFVIVFHIKALVTNFLNLPVKTLKRNIDLY